MSGIESLINAIDGAKQTYASQRDRVVSAIKAASARSGVDFSYLMAKAQQESGLNPTAKASTSSATGLYQFVDQTWLRTIKTAGEKCGLGAVADKITLGSDGVARVSCAQDKKAILALRNNPEIAANMAAELAKANKESLQNGVGGRIGSTELYMAHFLGAGGASTFLEAMKTNPQAKAADLLPSAAAANKNVFFDKETGAAKTVKEIYAQFARKFDGATTQAMEVASTSGGQSYAAYRGGLSAMTAATPQSASWSGANLLSDMPSASFYVSSQTPTLSSPFATMLLAQSDAQSMAFDAQDYLAKFDRLRDRAEQG